MQKEIAGPLHLRRLSIREYDNTIRDLLGPMDYPGIPLPSEGPGDWGFTDPGEATTALHAETFLHAAEELARMAVVSSTTLLPSCTPETGPGGGQACAVHFIRDFGKRAFRRPLETEEVDDLLALYVQARGEPGATFKDAVAVLVQAFLQAPSFLYHRERGSEAPMRDGAAVRLGPYEVASRLSYMLWETMPDPALFAAADAGRLATGVEVAIQAERLLGDERATRSLASFHQQWLHMGDLAHLEKDGVAFPDFANSVRPSLERELGAFVHYVFNGDARLETLLLAPVAFATRATARLYGASAVAAEALGPGISKIDLDPTQRSGLLTQLAFLASNSSLGDSRPVKRGAAVWRWLLCLPISPPPADIQNEIANQIKNPMTEKEKAAARAAQGRCGVCHQALDPPGLAFERYDAIGGYRSTVAGAPIGSSGVVALPTTGPVRFVDAVDLMRGLAGTEEVRRCMARKWFRYGWGRSETPVEDEAIDGVYRRLATAESFNLRQLVLAVVQSRSFLLRLPDAGESP